jgi:hypothetical protein
VGRSEPFCTAIQLHCSRRSGAQRRQRPVRRSHVGSPVHRISWFLHGPRLASSIPCCGIPNRGLEMAEKDAQSSPVNLLQAPIRVKQWRGWLDKPDASATLQNKSNSCSFLRRGRHLTPDDEEAEDDVAEGLVVVLVVARHEPRHDVIFVLCSRRRARTMSMANP